MPPSSCVAGVETTVCGGHGIPRRISEAVCNGDDDDCDGSVGRRLRDRRHVRSSPVLLLRKRNAG